MNVINYEHNVLLLCIKKKITTHKPTVYTFGHKPFLYNYIYIYIIIF